MKFESDDILSYRDSLRVYITFEKQDKRGAKPRKLLHFYIYKKLTLEASEIIFFADPSAEKIVPLVISGTAFFPMLFTEKKFWKLRWKLRRQCAMCWKMSATKWSPPDDDRVTPCYLISVEYPCLFLRSITAPTKAERISGTLYHTVQLSPRKNVRAHSSQSCCPLWSPFFCDNFFDVGWRERAEGEIVESSRSHFKASMQRMRAAATKLFSSSCKRLISSIEAEFSGPRR